MKIILSGIRPTGNLHLGNYYGSMIHILGMQEIKENNCYCLIADWHSLTTHPDPNCLHPNVRNTLEEYLACGLDPQKVTIYRQSDIPEIAQLYLLLNMLAPVGELQKTVSFKEKIKQHPKNINAGLFTYPVLMASDILIVHAECVPVGKDQEQHLEMTRRYAQRFNHLYKVNYFKLPKAYEYKEKLLKIPGLNGSEKMGKSEENCIYLTDEPRIIEKKIKKAITDQGPVGENTKKPECIENLFVLLRTVSSKEVVDYYENLWKTGAKKWYEKLKRQLAEDIIQTTNPIRKRITNIRLSDGYLRKIIQKGAEKTRETAKKTITEIRQLMGFKPFES